MQEDLDPEFKQELGQTVAAMIPEEMQAEGMDLAEFAGNKMEAYGERIAHAIRLAQGHLPKGKELISEENIRHIFEGLEEGKNLKELMDISDDDYLNLYEFGAQLEENEHHSDAANIFLLLCFMQPQITPLWKALGIAEENLQRWDDSAAAFGTALSQDLQDVDLWIGLARAMVHQMKKDEAKHLLDEAKNQLDAEDHALIDEYKAMIG